MFVQQPNNKVNGPRCWPLVWGIHSWRVDSSHNEKRQYITCANQWNQCQCSKSSGWLCSGWYVIQMINDGVRKIRPHLGENHGYISPNYEKYPRESPLSIPILNVMANYKRQYSTLYQYIQTQRYEQNTSWFWRKSRLHLSVSWKTHIRIITLYPIL